MMFGKKNDSTNLSQANSIKIEGLVDRGPFGLLGAALAGVAAPIAWAGYGALSPAGPFSPGWAGFPEGCLLFGLSAGVAHTLVRRADEIIKSHKSNGKFVDRASLLSQSGLDLAKTTGVVVLSALAINYVDDHNMIPFKNDGFVQTSVRLAHTLNPWDKHGDHNTKSPMYPSVALTDAPINDGKSSYPFWYLKPGDKVCVIAKDSPSILGYQTIIQTRQGIRYALGSYKDNFKPDPTGTACDRFAPRRPKRDENISQSDLTPGG